MRRALLEYAGLRLGLTVVLAVLAWLVGLQWLLAIVVGVIVASVLSLFVLRRQNEQLSSAIAAARGRRPASPGRSTPGSAGQAADDLYDDPYDDDPYADTQDSTSSATPIKRP